MTLKELKAEVRAASPEAREELFTLLGVLRRARDPERARTLAEKVDDSIPMGVRGRGGAATRNRGSMIVGSFNDVTKPLNF